MDNTQKADVGQRYITALKERIATRTAAQKRAAAKAKGCDDDDDTDVASALKPLALKVLRHHRIPGDIESCKRTSVWTGHGRTPGLQIKTTLGVSLETPCAGVKAVEESMREMERAKGLAGELCQEISFLHGLLQPGKVAEFQTYVSRLWAPTSKGERIGAILAPLVEDFIACKRPALCKVA
jgi:hypothetical protein